MENLKSAGAILRAAYDELVSLRANQCDLEVLLDAMDVLSRYNIHRYTPVNSVFRDSEVSGRTPLVGVA